MTEQLNLIPTRAPAVTEQSVGWFLNVLAAQHDWQTAAELGFDSVDAKRLLRALANASEGKVLSGQRGYRLASHATLAELDHAEAWMKSQAKAMLERAVAIRIERNRRQESP